jgi:hypothetical protein
MARIDWPSEQAKDPSIAQVVHLISSGSLKGGKNASSETQAVQRYLREAKHLVIKNDTLYRTATLDGLPVSQLVIPESHRRIAIQGMHNDAGKLKRTYGWPDRGFIGMVLRKTLPSG